MKRRDFMCQVALGTALLPALAKCTESTAELPFRIQTPFPGAILHERHGEPVLGAEVAPDGSHTLNIRVAGTVQPGYQAGFVTVNGKRVQVSESGAFSTVATLRSRENSIQIASDTGASTRLKVYWAQESKPRFRLQVDDNSFFLRDIYQKKYASIFDCFYLDMWRDFHEKYGLKVVLNCFYSTPEHDFDLAMLSDRYRSEWEANADWLRLAFHAKNEFPDRPYDQASRAEVAADFDLVANHLTRVAGSAYRAPGIVHWGELRPEVHPLFYEYGARTLSGYFRKNAQNAYPVSFQLPNDVCEYLAEHDGWVDDRTGLVFSKMEFVINNTPLAAIIPSLEKALARPQTAEVIDLLTHEQYFWTFYKNYLPDHRDRVETALKFLTERGYVGVFLDDGFYGTGQVYTGSQLNFSFHKNCGSRGAQLQRRAKT